jgi:putative heme-binding domain-containing protein
MILPRLTAALLLLLIATGSSAAAETVAGLRVPPGFEVREFAGDDLAHDIFTMTLDPRGRVIVAGRGYIRLLIDDDSDGRADRAVQIADHPKDGAMGLLWEGDTLYAVGDGGLRRFKIGPDDKAVGPSELIRQLKTGGEHQAHAVRRGPDGWLYLLCGNMTDISSKDATRPNGPIANPVAGALLRLAPDLNGSDIVADGFRNAYDFDFNDDGEPFTYDSDNERCVGLPWYEGCRFYHLIPGGHYGWEAPQRAQFWRMPPYFPDVVAPIADLGRGSPTGVACYRHRQFPEKYRGSFFLADWTFGRVWNVPLKRKGSGYEGKPELFLEATGDQGFAPVALRVHPRTGDLYVAIGGRGTRGAVYRIRYTAGMTEARDFQTPALPSKNLVARIDHSDPLRLVPLQPGGAIDGSRGPLFTLRKWERSIGDIGAQEAQGTVFEGYTLRSSQEVPAELRERIRAQFHSHFGKGSRELDYELARALALIADGDAEAFRLVASKLWNDRDPVDDIHYLIVLARMTAPRTAAHTAMIADALLGLDRKFARRKLNRDNNWPPRITEMHTELSRKDSALNAAMLEHAEFARPGNAVFTRAPGFDRRKAAERFLAASERDATFAWSVELVQLMVELPPDRRRPVLTRLWDRGGFEDAILPIFAKDPQPDDRPKLFDGLRSPQLAQVKTCIGAIEKLPVSHEPSESLALVRALRALPDDKAAGPVADCLAAYLRRATGQSFGRDRAAWTDWLTKAHPDIAAKLGGPDGVDVAGWQKRFAGIDWGQGDGQRGQAVFTKASCATCHSGGQALGPDLRGVGGRFSRDDLLTAIIQPSKDVSARYRTTQITTTDGKVYQGLIIYEAVDGLILQTGAATTVRIAGGQIESRGVTETSLMPAGLLDKLIDREIADLLAYLKALK